jgi:hypothetical protein
MTDFRVETSASVKPSTKRLELIKQIESLQGFYYDIGYDTQNIKTIFSLTLSFLKGQVNKLVVKSFFDVLMSQNKLTLNKEINLLNCFDELVDTLEQEDSIAPTLSIEDAKAETVKVPEQQHLNFREAA